MTFKPAAEIYRLFETQNVPASGAHQIDKRDNLNFMMGLESVLGIGVLAGAKWKATLSALNSDLVAAADTVAVVYNDITAENNGLYTKTGASGSGMWVQRLRFLPGYQFVSAANAGTGTANAIIATTILPFPTADGAGLISLPIVAANTGAATVSFNNGPALNIVTATGSDIGAGYLAPNMIVLGVKQGTTFRLLSDYASGAIVAAAEAARDAAIAAAGAANTTAMATIAALKGLAPSAYAIVKTKGYYTAGDGGGADYYGATGQPAGTYIDNGGTIILPTGGNGSAAWLARSPMLRALQWGLKGDGVTDDSARAQKFLDNNKGRSIVFDGEDKIYLIQGLLLYGADYNGTRIEFEGWHYLKPAPTQPSNNLQNACWTGVAVVGVDGVSINGRFHGNRANQQQRQQTFCLTLAGATNFTSQHLRFREIRGDGLYISTLNIIEESANCDSLTFGQIIGDNSEDDGRNLVSVISGDNIHIESVRSLRIGGYINGELMPGGFDIESDNSYQSVKNVTIGTIHVDTIGSIGFGVYGQPGTSSVRSVKIGTVFVTNHATPAKLDEFGATTLVENYLGNISNCEDVQISSFTGRFVNAYGHGLLCDNVNNFKIKAQVYKVWTGAALGVNSSAGNGIVDSEIDITVTSPARWGISTGKLTRTTIKGSVGPPQIAFYSDRFGVFCQGGYVQTDVTYKFQVPYNGGWTKAYRNDGTAPCTFTNTRIKGVTFSAAWASYEAMVSSMGVMREECFGYTLSALGVPNGGTHLWGQYIKNGNPIVGSPKGWHCTVAGTPGTWVSEGNL